MSDRSNQEEPLPASDNEQYFEHRGSMYRLLGSENGLRSSEASKDELDVLLAGHLESVDSASRARLKILAAALDPILRFPGSRQQLRIGDAILHNLNSTVGHPRTRKPSYEDIVLGAPGCPILHVPRFIMQSNSQVTRNSSGDVIRSSRADAAAGTLEVAAAVGEYAGAQWPSSEQFVLGFNRSEASIGGILRVPAHSAGAQLMVSAYLSVEHLGSAGGPTAGTGGALLYASSLGHDLPLRGAAACWCNAGLSIYGAQGFARVSERVASEWHTADGAEERFDGAPNGVIHLAATVALAAETSTVSLFVDVRCFAAVEESQEQFTTGFAVFECRNKPPTELNGVYIQPSRIRVRNIVARLCEPAVLMTEVPSTDSH